ncbi:MAG: hypothetical protein ING89_15350 [Rubrivivax sp.]|nr:hypothetical protein [Rubrivivax sp.]
MSGARPASGILEIRAWSRAVDARVAALRVDDESHPVIVAGDFGLEFDKGARQVNLARCDPWFLRAVEMSGDGCYDERRRVWYDRVLQAFALAHLDHIRGKFALAGTVEHVVLSAVALPGFAAAPTESLPMRLLATGPQEPSVIQVICMQFAAGNARSLLMRHGESLLELATAVSLRQR